MCNIIVTNYLNLSLPGSSFKKKKHCPLPYQQNTFKPPSRHNSLMDERLRIVKGDITTLRVDAIVNAANKTLLGGGGVDGAIHRAAGPLLLEECRSLPEVRPGVRCPVGEARLTKGYNLPSKYVIHTVGPVWKGGGHGEEELLTNAYTNSLRLAVHHQLSSVAFPLISAGAYRFPLEKAALIALRSIRDFLHHNDSLREVILVCYTDDAYHACLSAAKSLGLTTRD